LSVAFNLSRKLPPMNPMMMLALLLIVVLGLALVVCLVSIHDLQDELARVKASLNQPCVIFSFEGPQEIFSVKNVSTTPVSLVVIQDLHLSLLLEFQKTVTLKFEPVPMIGPREAIPLRYKILDGGYPMPADAQNSFLPHLKAGSFEAHIAYRDWQNVPRQAVIVKDKDRFFAKS
jgi:hypothetical protein